MSSHWDCDNKVPQSGDLNDQDVYHVTGLTSSKDDSTDSVTLALNEEELEKAYTESCARADASYEEFREEVYRDANQAASDVYPAYRDLNNATNDNAAGQRILWGRICIKWRWIRIYIFWHI